MNNSFENVLKQYEENNKKIPYNGMQYYIKEEQYVTIKRLLRMELATLIEANANDSMIDHLMQIDVDLTDQYNTQITAYDISIDNDLPF
jgi:hypothetical protein